MITERLPRIVLCLLLLAPPVAAQRPRTAFPMQATRAAYLDEQGVIRWKDDTSEVALYGAKVERLQLSLRLEGYAATRASAPGGVEIESVTIGFR